MSQPQNKSTANHQEIKELLNAQELVRDHFGNQSPEAEQLARGIIRKIKQTMQYQPRPRDKRPLIKISDREIADLVEDQSVKDLDLAFGRQR